MNRYFGISNRLMEKSIEKLTLGQQVNKAADNASSLAISERLKSSTTGLKQGIRNAQDGISLIQTVEGALIETHTILHRMRELAVQSSSDTYEPADRVDIQNELTELIHEIDRIANHTEFNTQTFLDGKFTEKLNFSFGNSGNELKLALDDMSAAGLGLIIEENGITQAEEISYKIIGADGTIILDISSAEKASLAISVIDKAILKVGSVRTNLGANQNRLESTIANLSVSVENLKASESRIRDLDMPKEIMDFTKQQILNDSITTMLAHTQIQPVTVMALIIE